MNKIRQILLLLALTLCTYAHAHDFEPLLGQFSQMPSLYNPAATGLSDFIRIRGDARLQWIGIDNAPKTFSGTADMPVKLGKKRIGIGVMVQQEGLGLFSNLEAGLQASYKLKLLGGTLSIGVQGSYLNSKFKGSEVILPDDDDYHEGTDEAIPTQDLSGNKFDFSAGLWFDHKFFYAGISGRHLLDPSIALKMEGSENTEAMEYETRRARTLYFTAGSNIPIKNTLIELQPAIIAATDLTDFTGIVEMRARYNRFISVGIGYRYLSGISLSLGAEYKNFFLGYSYEYPLSAIAKASAGSHEIVAGYQLKLDFSAKNKNRHRSIRIM